MLRLSAILAVSLAVVAVATLVTVYLVYRLSAKSDKSRVDVLRGRTARFGQGAPEPIRLDAKRIRATTNGESYSVTAWISLDAHDGTAVTSPAPSPAIILHRVAPPAATPITPPAAPSAPATTGNPIVAIDADTNRLVVMVRTTRSTDMLLDGAVHDPQSARAKGWIVGVVDYMPMQRWVHVGAVVTGGRVMLFLDGQLYTTEGLAQMKLPAGDARPPMFAGASGDVVVGGVTASPGARGEVRKVLWHDHALSAKEVSAAYAEGHTTARATAMQRLGMGAAWGWRSPVYRPKK